MPQSFANLLIHVIFSTKHRQNSIDNEWSTRLYEYLSGTLRKLGSPLIVGGGMPDHVHLLVSLSRETSVVELVRNVKANSSRWIHETIPNHSDFAWQAGYAAFSVSESAVMDVRQYIEQQQKHHQTRSFRDELRTFLDKHRIKYDEKYVWD